MEKNIEIPWAQLCTQLIHLLITYLGFAEECLAVVVVVLVVVVLLSGFFSSWRMRAGVCVWGNPKQHMKLQQP